MYRSLLVPLDGSSFGEHALPFACSIAGRSGVRRLLVGSVADKILRSAWLPVLLYRPCESAPSR